MADQMLEVDCSKLRLSKANDEYNCNLKLEANQTNEIRSGCPLYYGEELKMEEPWSFRHKRFNPVFDFVNKRVNSECMDIEDLVKFGKAQHLCPYYVAKSRLASADIIILPY